MRCSCRGERRGEEEGREGSGGAAEDGVELGEDLVPLLGRVREVRDGAAGAERQVCSRRKREELSCATEMEEETSGRDERERGRTSAALDEGADHDGPVARPVDGEEAEDACRSTSPSGRNGVGRRARARRRTHQSRRCAGRAARGRRGAAGCAAWARRSSSLQGQLGIRIERA